MSLAISDAVSARLYDAHFVDRACEELAREHVVATDAERAVAYRDRSRLGA
jgi:hypothetical protein